MIVRITKAGLKDKIYPVEANMKASVSIETNLHSHYGMQIPFAGKPDKKLEVTFTNLYKLVNHLYDQSFQRKPFHLKFVDKTHVFYFYNCYLKQYDITRDIFYNDCIDCIFGFEKSRTKPKGQNVFNSTNIAG